MHELGNKKTNALELNRTINAIMLGGLFIRLFVLGMMVAFGTKRAELYFLSDDVQYEATAQSYLLYANSLIDLPYLERLVKGYMQPFWPTVMCLSSRLLGTVFAGRILNTILSTMSIKLVYQITLMMSGKARTALAAGKLAAFLPITILTCCFPIKDIFLCWATLYVFLIFLKIYYGHKLTKLNCLIFFGCLVGIFYTRGALTEMLLMFMVVVLLRNCYVAKNYRALMGLAAILAVAVILFGDHVIEAFETKIDDYSDYNTMSDGFLSMLQMQHIGQIYKMPFAYVYATFQPAKLKLFASSSTSIWLQIISYLNISIYPVAIANMLYVFQKKHNLLIWFLGVLLYCAIILFSLGIFRHYLFLLPFTIINAALYLDRPTYNKKLVVTLGSLCVFLAILLYSFI